MEKDVSSISLLSFKQIQKFLDNNGIESEKILLINSVINE